MENTLSFLPLGGIGDVTRNLYLYQYQDSILIVDCGLGFPDETMLGIDLLLPDVQYLIETKKKIVGMVLSHGHEDHIGAVPFVLPQIPQDFPIFASPLTAAFTNEKLREFGINKTVQTVKFEDGPVKMGPFTASFIRLTHSIPDTANIFIETPVGNFYHGSDFKFDLTPYDKKPTDMQKIVELSKKGVTCLFSDCLGSERPGHTPSELTISDNFEKQIRDCKGKFIITTFASNVSRLNQAITLARKYGRKVCFVGRSLVKANEIAKQLGYSEMQPGQEVKMEQLRHVKDNQVMLLIAGSQGQENSAMTRIAEGEHRDIKLTPDDTVVFSSDAIPGNEISIFSLIDSLMRRGVKVVYSGNASGFHVSGHGGALDLQLMITLTRPQKLIPIGGNFHHMAAYQKLAMELGYKKSDTLLLSDGQEVLFGKNFVKLGKKYESRKVYVDEVSGEAVSHYILRDRQKLSENGIVVVMVEVASENGTLVEPPTIVVRGFTIPDTKELSMKLHRELTGSFGDKKGRVTNVIALRKRVSELSEKLFFRELRRNPLILPIVIEV